MNTIWGKRLVDIKFSKDGKITGRHVFGPLIAITMAGLFFVYSRSTVYAAKRNAQLTREADGGQISWRNESERRHKRLAAPQEKFSIHNFVTHPGEGKTREDKQAPISKEERAIRAQRSAVAAKSLR